MKRADWAVVVTTSCVVVVALWWRFGFERAQPAVAGEPTRPSATTASEVALVVAGEGHAPPPQDLPPPVPSEDYAAQLRAAPDYLDFVRSLLSAARAGDHAAQFYIFRALDYCDDGYRGYFGGQGRRRTLDEALKWASTRWPRDSEEIFRVHGRCHTLMETDVKDLGERGEWLRQAAEGGYPLAQVIGARKQLFLGADPDKREEPRSLVAKAIRSRDPEVIWEIGLAPLDIDPANEAVSDHRAWWLAACLRGFDCSPQSGWMWQMCRYDPNCQPYESWPDLLRRTSGNDFPEIEARARWINEKIDAGDWEALGF